MKLVRSGNTFTAYRSSNGVTWTLYAASPVTVAMSANVYVGLVMTSNDNSVLGTATLDGVSVASGPLPAPWTKQDVGAVGMAGTATYAAGVFQVTGSGANIAGTSNGFHFIYQPMSGDGEIVARITGVENTTANSKGGIMIRETLAADSSNVAMILTGGNRFQFQVRPSTGATTSNWSGSQTSPHWVKLVRSGNTFTAYRSSNGVTWTLYAASPVVVAMSANVLVGLVMTSNDNTILGTADRQRRREPLSRGRNLDRMRRRWRGSSVSPRLARYFSAPARPVARAAREGHVGWLGNFCPRGGVARSCRKPGPSGTHGS